MASGKITNKNTISGSISSGNNLKNAAIAGGSGTTDHSRLINRDDENQHPIEAITNLREELDSKLNSKTALPLINEALQSKAKGLYFDALKELARKSYWYLTAEIDPKTGLGTKDSIISGPYDLGMGGGSGGGGGGVTTVSVKQVNWPSAAPVGESSTPTRISINWSSVIGEDRSPTGEGTIYLSINGKQIETRTKQPQGVVSFDVSKYLVSGDNSIQIKVLDMYGTTGITVGVINGVALKLSSTFDSSVAFYDRIDYTYTPVGNVDKKVYFIVDEDVNNAAVEIVKSSNEQQTFIIRNLSHGAHTLRVYFEATISGQTIRSNELFYDLTYVQAGNTTPIIASDFNTFTQEQYTSFKIPYRVFIDGRNMAQVVLKANGEIIRTSEVTTNGVHIWTYRADIPYSSSNPLVLEIVCGTVTKQFKIIVKESAITITPILENLELALSAQSRSNDEFAELREIWEYTNTTDVENPITYKSIFEDFNWSSDGWVLDEQNTNVLRVGGAARVQIPFEVFAKDFTTRGKTIELEIATRGIRNYDTTIISCLDKVKSPFYEVEEFFEEEETRLKGYEVSYTYSTLTSAITTEGKHLFTYDGSSWTLNGAKINLNDYGITLTETLLNVEGEDVGTVIKGDRILVTFSMEARGFEVTPQVASIRSQQSFLSTQYKEDEHIRLAFVVEPNTADKNRIIWMYINGVASGAMQYPSDDIFKQESPSYITIGSSEAIVDIYNIRIYNSALTNKQIVNNWIADTADAADKAYRFNHNSILTEQDQLTPESLLIGAPDLPYIIWGIDPLPQSKNDVRPGTARYVDPTDSTRNFTAIDAEYKVQGTSSSVYPTKNIRLRTKKGKGGPNLEWYDDDGNDLLIKNGGKGFPITTPNGIGVDYFTFKVDYASSEGANNVELVKLYNDASIAYGLLTPPQQQDARIRVGIDGFPVAAFQKDANDNLIFTTKANFNNDKSNPDVYGFADGDESWETTNNSAAETKYQKPVTADNFAKGFEIRFPDEDGYGANNPETELQKLSAMTAWVYSTYQAEADPNRKLEPAVTLTYTEAVAAEGGDYSAKEVTKTFEYDTKEYRLAKFKAELAEWFNVDSCLFYYLFTELFLMIDSRAKNAFPTYFKSRQEGDGGDRWFWIPYDMDTAIGIDNKGKLTFDYYLEDIDQLDGADVYNGQSSVMWCNIRDAFRPELASMYLKLRNQGLISYAEVDKRFSEHQNKWPEVLLNLDAHNKYIVPLKNGDNYLEMLQGTKEQQRRWWLYNRFKYMDSKYNAGDAKADFIQFRAYVDIGQVKPDLEITPYANIYATASFGNGNEHLVSKRVLTRGEPITLENTFRVEDDENDQETYIYSASQLKSIGDISPFHPDTVKIGNAIRLQDLKVGDASSSYKNPYLKELTVGANTLLKTIDARNCVNLGTGTTVAPDLSQCTNIEEIYFTGTKIKGITLPDGGTINTLHLPGTLTSLTIRNQPLLDDLLIENTNTTITKSVNKEGGYSFRGLVVEKEAWNTTSANANLYLADSLDSDAPKIRVSIAEKDLYDDIVKTKSILSVSCTHIDARFDLLEDESIKLAEYSTRFANSVIDTESTITNITLLIKEVAAAITPPTLVEFKTSLIERLWLEGIPSSAIRAKEFIKNMLPGTEVRLININETYSSWEEIKEFYDLLDRHYGINFNDSPVRPKAQVTGVINIDTISYKNYIELTARYPEVTINAKKIISTVEFYNNNILYATINIPLLTSLDVANKLTIIGKKIHAPLNPTKESTQANYYIFENWAVKKAVYTETFNWEYESDSEVWTENYLVIANTRIDAVYSEHLQEYKVTFDTDSDVISVDASHKELIVKYGSTITAPETFGVPEGVILQGWFLPSDDQWIFEGENASKVLDHIVLKAKWTDENKPTVSVARQTYNTFRYEARDNLGIVKWAVVKDSTAEPTVWNTITSTTHLTGSYEITAAGTYYFWISDANGNKNETLAVIIAHPIEVHSTPGITKSNYFFTEGLNNFITDFAISGTTLKLSVAPDEHYENLSIKINKALAENFESFIVANSMEVDLSCTPKDYIVTFNLLGKGDQDKALPQQITYLHNAQRPFAQYYQPTGEIIDSWYLDNTFLHRWDFDTDVVEGPLTLYAKWEAYHTPTVLTIRVPEGMDSDRTVGLSYSQYRIDSDHKVIIDWGDGSANYSTDVEGQPLHPSHTYSSGGDYSIKIYGVGGNTEAYYRLGDGYGYTLVMPSEYLIDAKFSWDIAELATYALMGSSISQAHITEYMTKISTGCYGNCLQLKVIEIPENIVEIEDQAFSGCKAATGTVKIPSLITRIGYNAFDYCESLTGLELLCEGTPAIYSQFCRYCTSLTDLKISDHLDIPSEAFVGSGFKKLVLNNKRIGERAFAGCSKLEEVIVNSEFLDKQAFSNCSNLSTVILTNKDLEVSTFVFQKCPNLQTIGPLSDPVNGEYKYDLNYAWDTKIPDYAFERDWSSRWEIQSIEFPITLKKLGKLVLHNAVGITKIELPAGLESIGEQAFESCLNLKELVIPGNVKDIGPKAFAGCTGLTKVILKLTSSITKINIPDDSWFLNSNPDLNLYIPSIIFDTASDCYGLHWNACKTTNSNWVYLEYKEYNESIE